MAVRIMGMVWELTAEQIDQNEKYVLLCYADHADHDGKNIFPGIALIARKTGYDERSVRRITRRLEEKGFLSPEGGQQGGRGVTPRWSMPVKGDKLSPFQAAERGTTDAQKGDKSNSGLPVKGDIAVSPEPLTISEPLVVNERVGELFKVYEQEIEPLTPAIRDGINDELDVEHTPAEEIIDAIQVAAKANKRRWDYIEGILRNRRTQKSRPRSERKHGNIGTGTSQQPTKPAFTQADLDCAARINAANRARRELPAVP